MKIVMIADDSPVIRKVGRRLLEELGFVVVEAHDGFDAMEMCRNNMPDAVIVDRDMPGPNALEVVREIRRMPDAEDVKILYCLSEILVSEMAKAKRAGANSFLLKPFTRDVLGGKLAEAGIEIPGSEAAA